MLRLDLCDFSDTCIVVKGTITVTGTNNRSRKNITLAFTSNAPFISCISRVNNTLIDNLQSFDTRCCNAHVHLIEYSKNIERQQAVCGIIELLQR